MKLVFDSRRAAIRLAKRLRYENPICRFRRFADELNRRGHPNTRGGPFNYVSVETRLGEKSHGRRDKAPRRR